MLSFGEQSTRHLLGESHGKALAFTDKSKGTKFHAKKCRNTEFNPFLMQNIFSIFSPAENFE
jgi:hypothetical protein